MQVQSLGWEDPPKEVMETIPVLPEKSHGGEPNGPQSIGLQRVGHD